MKRSTLFVMLVSGLFAAWFLLLSILAMFSDRNPVFHDSLAGIDVNGQYVSEIPVLRYIIEPFAGFAYTFVQYPIDAIVGMLIIYTVFRVVLLLLERGLLKDSVKVKVIATFLRNTTNFFWKYLGIGLIVGLAILLPGWAIAGFHFFMTTYMGGLHILVVFGFAILCFKVGWNAIILFHKRISLRIAPPPSWTSLPKRSGGYWVRKVPDVFVRETKYAVAALLVGLIVYGTIAGLQLPNYVIRTSLGPDEYLIDFHTHTYYSDGSLTPAERVESYIQQGISGAAFTDHDNMRGALEAKQYVEQNHRPFMVIIGQEYTDMDIDIHLNIYGTTEQYAPLAQLSPLYPDVHFLNVSDCIIAAKAAGGFVTVNHYSGSPGKPYTYADLAAWGVDGFEIVNGARDFPAAITAYCIANNLACIGGTDEHMTKDINTFVKINLTDPSDVSVIFATLKLNTHQVVRVEYTTNPLSIEEPSRGINPVMPFVNYFLNLDAGQYASWFAWSSIMYVVFLIFTIMVRRMDTSAVVRKVVVDPAKKGHLYRQLKAYVDSSRGGR